MSSRRRPKRGEAHGPYRTYVSIRFRRECFQQAEEKKVTCHDVFDASNLDELRDKIVDLKQLRQQP